MSQILRTYITVRCERFCTENFSVHLEYNCKEGKWHVVGSFDSSRLEMLSASSSARPSFVGAMYYKRQSNKKGMYVPTRDVCVQYFRLGCFWDQSVVL